MRHDTSDMASWMSLGVVAIIVAIVAFGLMGCDKSSSTSGSGGASDAAAASHGDPEAVKAVQDELDKHWVKAGAGWVSEFPSKVSLGTGQRAGPESFYRQIKSLAFTIEPNEISESDKLNGIQFSGHCDFNNPPVRLYNDPNAFGPPKWSAWQPSIASAVVFKVKGQWKVQSGDYVISGTKPAADVLAKLLAEAEKAGG